MTEKEYNIEVLCTCYSLNRLSEQRKKVIANKARVGRDVIDVATLDELTIAISTYDEKIYKDVRDDLKKINENSLPYRKNYYTP